MNASLTLDIKVALILLAIYQNGELEFPSDHRHQNLLLQLREIGPFNDPIIFDNEGIPQIPFETSLFNCQAFYESIDYNPQFFQII
jgi:hypothetical protein